MMNLNVDEGPVENNIATPQIASPEEEKSPSTSNVNNLKSETPKVTLTKSNSVYKKIKKIIVPKKIKKNDLESNETRAPEINEVKNKNKKGTWKNVFKTKIAVAS